MDDLSAGYRLLVVVLVLLLNAFFAAAEVSLVSVRESRLNQMAASGHPGAKSALWLLAHPERLLSVVQVGVTLASLGLGWAGESTVYEWVVSLIGPAVPEPFAGGLHGISFAVAFLLITYAHVVIGEVVPKNLAFERSDRLSVLVAPPLLLFFRVVSPLVYVIERSATALSRLLGLRADSPAPVHSPEELKFIIAASRRQGHLESFEEAAIRHLLNMQDYLVREIMVPRSEILSIGVNVDLSTALQVIHEHKFSRFPVFDGEPENIVGVVHYKDLLEFWYSRRSSDERSRTPPFHLRQMMTKPHVVPETKPVNEMVDEFRNARSHMAIVVDEFGTVVGLVTIEDVLEQIFGEIEDEHDVERPPVVSQSSELELEGRISIRDLEVQYGIVLPVDAGFETLAGFLLDRLGCIPNGGETLDYDSLRFTVLEMEKNRIVRVKVERLAAGDGEDEEQGEEE